MSGCSCAQHGVEGLDALLTLLSEGVEQWEASRRLWPPDDERSTTGPDAVTAF